MGILYSLLWTFSSYVILGKPYGIEFGAWITYASVCWRKLRTICKEGFVLLVFTWSTSKWRHLFRCKAERVASAEILQ